MEEIKPLNDSFLRKWEIKLVNKLSKYVPSFMGTKILTFLCLLSSFLIFLSYYLSKEKPLFLFFASFFILTQWIFDCLDGTIGRLRKEGFIRWGYFMDHLFDYFFMSSIVFGFYFLFPILKFQILLIFFIFSSFMVTSFLMHSVIKDKEVDFSISFLGFSPIEFRLIVILFNTSLYLFNDFMTYLVSKYLLYFNLLLLIFLIIVIYINQKKLGDIDVSEKPG